MSRLLKNTSLTNDFADFKLGLSDLMKFSTEVRSVLTHEGPDPTRISGDPEKAAITNMANAALRDRPVSNAPGDFPVSFECTGFGASFTSRNGLEFGWKNQNPSHSPHEDDSAVWQFYIKPDPDSLEHIHKEATKLGWREISPSFVS